VSDLPLPLPADGATVLRLALDQERKIDRALETLGPLSGRDVLVLDGGPDELARTAAAGARVTPVPSGLPLAAAKASADAVVSRWTAFRAVDADAVAEADRVLRPGGRLLVVHDYGRDDVSLVRGDLEEHGDWTRRDGPLLTRGFRIRVLRPGGRLLVVHDYGRDDVSLVRGDLEEHGDWTRRDGPLLTRGFRIRVLHCFWTFDTIDDARAFLMGSFGDPGRVVGETLKRPRLSYNVAVYHRTRGGAVAAGQDGAG
jgi:SAM-dependent methyltransferase